MSKRQYLSAAVFGFVIIVSALWGRQIWAHGATQNPISRALACYLEGAENPTSAACQAAHAVGGPQPFYDWNAINIGDAAGRHRELIPDGQLCSAGNAKYAGFDLARADWPAQTLPANGGAYTFTYHATAPHSTAYFDFYVTKDGYDPTTSLAWDSLEATPFCHITSPTTAGDGYALDCQLPAGKSGRHLIYTIWQRDDSAEAFYSCSDVIFSDNGNTPTPAPTSEPTATPVVTEEPTTAPTATTTPGDNGCSADAWQSEAIYVADDQVSHNGFEWRAKWWTQGEEPGTTGQWGVWEELQVCAAGGATSPDGNAATSSTLYLPVVANQ